MIREVLRMGDARLLEISRPVERFGTPELAALLADMGDTMAHLNGAGLAAPQIGVGLRVVIFGVKSNARYPHVEEVPDTVLINPVLQPEADEQEEDWEGCLSVPGMRGWVPRWRRLRYRGVDERGNSFERQVEGFHSSGGRSCPGNSASMKPNLLRSRMRIGYRMPSRWSHSCCTTRAWKPSTVRSKRLPCSSQPA